MTFVVGSTWCMKKNAPCTCPVCEGNKGKLFTLIKIVGEFVTMKSNTTGEEISQGTGGAFDKYFTLVTNEYEEIL